jgi:hypothetical protein
MAPCHRVAATKGERVLVFLGDAIRRDGTKRTGFQTGRVPPGVHERACQDLTCRLYVLLLWQRVSISPRVPLPHIALLVYDQVVTLDSKRCPPDLEEVAEAYVMGTLSEEQAIAFVDHYAACDTCATVLYKIADYFDAMRAAAKSLRAEPFRASASSVN